MARICIVSPSLKLGGIERQLVLLSNYFISQKHEVYFIICLKHDRFYSLNSKVKLIEPNFSRDIGFLNKLIYYVKILWFIRFSVKNVAPDTVLTFGDGLNSRVLLSLLGTGFPVYISDRTSISFRIGFLKSKMKKILYPYSKGFIAQTKFVADYNRFFFNEKLNIKVIPNILVVHDSDSFKKENIILYSGRISQEKGPELLLKAFNQIKDKSAGWKLYFAGSGPQLGEIRALTQSFRLTDSVVFLGNVENIFDLYNMSEIFVLPSRHEGYPNSLVEAMASGLACICFDSFPAHEIIDNNINGIIVERENIDLLASSILYLINNEEIRKKYGREAKNIKLKLSPEVIGKSFENFILNSYLT